MFEFTEKGKSLTGQENEFHSMAESNAHHPVPEKESAVNCMVKIAVIILTIFCVFGNISAACAAESFTVDGFEYRVTGRKTVEIIGYSGTDSQPYIRSDVEGYDIVGIAGSAFKDNHFVENFVIWADLEYIGDYAFYNCTALTEIYIPSETKTIGASAFEGCVNLTDVVFWGGEEIGKAAFKDCTGLKDISIPSEMVTIGESAFENCTGLESVVFWGGNTIGEKAFKNCTGLTEIYLPSSMESIGDFAFAGCSNLESYLCWNDDIEIADNAFDGCLLSADRNDDEEAETTSESDEENMDTLNAKCTVQIHINFIPNLFFSTYDVEMTINKGNKNLLDHGKDADFVFELAEGTYTIRFNSAADSSVYGQTELEVTSDIEASYKIFCYSDEVKVEVEYIDCEKEILPDQVKVSFDKYAFFGENYEEVVDTLKELGFTNVKTVPQYDIIFGWTTEGSVDNISIDGTEDYNRGCIFNKDAEVVVTYHLKAENAPSTDSPSFEAADEDVAQQEESEEYVNNLTVENCELLAKMLQAKNPGNLIDQFITQYRGCIIEFDGNIAYMSKHGNYNTRWDILIYAGDYSETSVAGPNFQFRDVNYYDLELTGQNIPDSVCAGQNYHIVAEVVRYDANSELLILEPISMELR